MKSGLLIIGFYNENTLIELMIRVLLDAFKTHFPILL